MAGSLPEGVNRWLLLGWMHLSAPVTRLEAPSVCPRPAMVRENPQSARMQRYTNSGLRLLSGCVLSSVFCPAALSLPSYLDISQLYHTQWSAPEGAPTGSEALTQTKDGFLWLGTEAGLFRFDGVTFERISAVGGTPLISHDLYQLYAPQDGGLWIGYRFGGVSFLKDGHLTNYGQAEGLPAASASGFIKDENGTMWVGTSRGVYWLDHGNWRLVSADRNLPRGYVVGMQLDRDNVLWTIDNNSVYYLRPGERRFELLDVDIGDIETGQLVRGSDGVVRLFSFASREKYGLLDLRVPGKPGPFVAHWDTRISPPSIYSVGMFDRAGNFWVTDTDGLRRYPLLNKNATEAQWEHSRADVVPLTAKHAYQIREDREGNIWISTSGGIERLRAPTLVKVPLQTDSMFFPMAPAANGGMWIGTSQGYIYRFSAAGEQLIANGTPMSLLDGFYGDPSGDLWVGGMDALWHLQGNHWDRFPRPPVKTGGLGNIQSLTKDASGAMWVSVVRVGVYRVVDGKWTLWGGRTDLPPEPATTLVTDHFGRLWLGYVNGRVAMLEGNHLALFSPAQTRLPGPILAFAQQGKQVWVGGEQGLAYFDGGLFHPVSGFGRGAFTLVSGIVVTDDGDVWLNTADGVIYIAAAEVQRLFANPTYEVRYKQLTYLDGLPGTPMAIRPLPTAAASGDGRIWFSTSNGVVWTDPKRTQLNKVVPTVSIRSIVADGKAYPTDAAQSLTRLPSNTRNLQIAYTAPSLTIPERVGFRYRLEGNDTDWQDVGTRREAYFTDLKPGQYRFHVIASNNDGVWNETGTAVEFVIPPTFIQTRWFFALCATVGLAALWVLFLLRLRQVKARLRWRLEERLVERERIARELHDTFLQGVQGLMLRFQSAMERIPPTEPARALMEEALDRADGVLADGRDAVTNLRASTQSSADLPSSLKMHGERLAEDYGAAFSVCVDGEPRKLHPVAKEETYRIGAEALVNAFQHAQADHIKLHITYGRKSLLVRISDDGRGFDPEQLRSGHWGLTGMHERAARIRGQLTIRSQPLGGSVVQLEVPARIAFKQPEGARPGKIRHLWLRATGVE
jgi:signal transduction histidine kinase/ligand-binding sensor domain-containing protein